MKCIIKYINLNKLKNNSGSIMIVILLILGIMTLVVVGLSGMITQSLKASKNQEYSVAAYFAAETGLERILYEIKNNNFDMTGCMTGDCIVFKTSPLKTDCSDKLCATNVQLLVSDNIYYQVKYSTTTANGYEENVYLSTGSKGSEVSRMIRASN
jgi:Tfp pilus assembly protein PilX